MPTSNRRNFGNVNKGCCGACGENKAYKIHIVMTEKTIAAVYPENHWIQKQHEETKVKMSDLQTDEHGVTSLKNAEWGRKIAAKMEEMDDLLYGEEN